MKSSPVRHRLIATAIFAVWSTVVGSALWRHVPWRDEVRAYSRALAGRNVFAMLQGIHGEGHPALWYLLLRGVHALLPRPQALPVAAFLVAAAAVWVLLWRAPFSWPIKGLIVAGNGLLFEYSVMARNYGISVLLLFLLAACYRRYRTRGILPGILLFLLANTNVHSLVLVGGFLAFWLWDLADGRSLGRTFWLNAAIAGVGVAACILTVYPPVSDSAAGRPASLLPAESLQYLAPQLPGLLVFALLFASTFGLVRCRGLLLAAIATLLGLSALFVVVYPGQYRHVALWIAFLICCYWVAKERGTRIPAFGWGLFVILLALQVPIGISNIAGALGKSPPLSRSRDLAELIRRRPDLRDAVIVAEPDYLLESLPYYLSNPTYLLRERRFGNVVVWTRNARLQLSLGDVLESARELRTGGKPVLILLARPLNSQFPTHYREAYAWEFSTSPDQVSDFLGSTELLERTGPSLMGESFDVYLLK